MNSIQRADRSASQSTILVVDNDTKILAVVAAMLRASGYPVKSRDYRGWTAGRRKRI